MILDDLAVYTRDLLTYDPALIVIGRENVRADNSGIGYIAIDELVSIPSGYLAGYDEDAEQQTTAVQMKGDFTLNFYGDNARAVAAKWAALHVTQQAYELQRDLGFAVYHATSFRNLKQIEGSQYKNRFEIEVSLYFNESVVVDTLRIDTADPTIIVDL